MSRARIVYRARQFWKALFARPDRQDLVLARDTLGPEPLELFLKMQPGEQLHSLQVYRRVAASVKNAPAEESEPLLVAALLHDIGKSRCPLSPWERAIIVLGYALAPAAAKTWGEFDGPPTRKIPFWRRSFVVAAQHARWGAEMAASAGVTSLAVNLIRRHQEKTPGEPATLEDRLLQVLQSADNQT